MMLIRRVAIPFIFFLQTVLAMMGTALFSRGFNFLLWTNAAVNADIIRGSAEPSAEELARRYREKKLQGILFVTFGLFSVGLAVGMFALGRAIARHLNL